MHKLRTSTFKSVQLCAKGICHVHVEIQAQTKLVKKRQRTTHVTMLGGPCFLESTAPARAIRASDFL